MPDLNHTQVAALNLQQELLLGRPLHVAKAALKERSEDALMHAVVEDMESQMGNRMDAVAKTMALLEGAMDRDPTSVAQLMGALYPIAAENYLHEICDAIDIWIYDYHPEATASAFRDKADRLPPGHLKRKYAEWATLIDKSAHGRNGGPDYVE